jgi:SAM-dependent methyltransferase
MSENSYTCPACRQPGKPYPVGTREGYSYVGCPSCGTITLAPWPTAQLIEETFAAIEPQITHVPEPERQIEAAVKLLRKRLPAPVPNRNRLLDVHAMHGYNVMAAKQLGYNVTGINSYAHMHDFAAKNYGAQASFLQQSAEEYAASGEKTDIILAINSFSSLLDPDAHAAALKKILAPGGVIYIEENDGNHFNTPRDVAEWEVLEPPFTPAAYSREGLVKILGRHGLAVRKRAFTWAPYMRLTVGHKK